MLRGIGGKKMSELVLDKSFFIEVMKDLHEMIEEQRDYLTGLDSEIGDGDHGINLSIGFREVINQLEKIDAETEDISSFLRKVGMILLGKVGGASGPLYGSLFMKAGADVKGKTEVTFEEFCGMIVNGFKAVQARGKANVGDKTMIDAMVPGIEYLQDESNKGKDPVELFTGFVEKMKEGAESTIPLVAKKGRAMRLGERAIGHKDPGAESSWMIMEVFLNRLKKL